MAGRVAPGGNKPVSKQMPAVELQPQPTSGSGVEPTRTTASRAGPHPTA